MRRGRFFRTVVAGLIVALVAVGAVQFAASATSRSTKSIPSRVKTLEAKVRTLTAAIAQLQTRVGCLGAQGVTQWGNPPGNQGYVYTNDGVTFGITTAFDAPAPGQTPTFYAATVNPSCVSGSQKQAFKLGHVVAHRTAQLSAR